MPQKPRNTRAVLAKQIDGVFHTARKRTSFPAFLGDGSGVLLAYDPDGNPIPGFVMARIQFNDQTSVTVRRVRCDKVAMQYNLPVIVAYGRDGDLEVVETDPTTALAFSDGRGAQVGPHNWTHLRGGPDPLFLDGLFFMPFMVMPNNPPDLSIKVQPTHYVYGGTAAVSPSTPVDLTADVPTDDSQQSIVIVVLDPSDNTIETYVSAPATFISGGGETMPFTAADVVAASAAVPFGRWRLAAFRLYAGQTQILWSDFITSLQQYGDADPSGAFFPDFGTSGPGFLHQAASGADVTILKHNLSATSNPGTGDDSADGYSIGSLWLNITGDRVYMALDVSVGSAVWHQLDATGGGGGDDDSARFIAWSSL